MNLLDHACGAISWWILVSATDTIQAVVGAAVLSAYFGIGLMFHVVNVLNARDCE